MNLISWNCNMAFRRKWQYLLPYSPDIMVIQECEHESKYKSSEIIPDYNEFIWIGDNINKGIGVLSFHDYHIEIADCYTDEFRYVVPLIVRRGDQSCYLFAIWAMNHKVRAQSYVGQVWGALQHYETLLSDDTILVGDFNSNQIWDDERKQGNHTDCIRLLAAHDIKSLYHRQSLEPHGQERVPTIYLLKQKHKPYHLDYCCVSTSFIHTDTQMSIGGPEVWLPHSDHMPLFISGLSF